MQVEPEMSNNFLPVLNNFLETFERLATPHNLFSAQPMPFHYSINAPTKIVVIGCGGTGGWFLPKLVKILNESRAKFLLPGGDVEIILIDGDVVEHKNLARQNFIARDIGSNKAEVMCKRYAPHLVKGLNMYFIDKFVSNRTLMSKIPADKREKFFDFAELMGRNDDQQSVLIFNFIDNAISRQAIHHTMLNNYLQTGERSVPKMYCLDVANNQYNGQLNFTSFTTDTTLYRGRSDRARNAIGEGYDVVFRMAERLGYCLPMCPSNFFLKYPEHLDDNEYIKLENCADADAQAVSQLFNANDTAATLCATTLTLMLENKGLKYGTYNFFTGPNMSITASDRICNYTNLGYYDLIGKVKGNADFADAMRQVSSLDYARALQPLRDLYQKMDRNFAKFVPK